MKKLSMIFTLAACVLAFSACGSKDNVETQSADLSSSAEETEAAGSSQSGSAAPGTTVALPEEYETEIMEGTVDSLQDNIVTVVDDEGTRLVFDITNAEQFEDELLMTGSYVEVDYAIVDGDIYPAEMITVLMDIEELAAAEDRDPAIWGIVQLLDINDIIIIDETGAERTFSKQMSRTVSFSDIKAGDRVQVTYGGSLLADDDAKNTGMGLEAIKIVAEDAIDSDEAKANYLIGEVDTIYTDVLTLTMEPETMKILIDDEMVEGIEEGDMVRAYYTGSVSGISVTGTEIVKIED